MMKKICNWMKNGLETVLCLIFLPIFCLIWKFVFWAFFDTERHIRKFIRKARKKGLSEEQIFQALLRINEEHHA